MESPKVTSCLSFTIISLIGSFGRRNMCIVVQGDFTVLDMGLHFITSTEQLVLKENKIECIFCYQPSVIGKMKEWYVPATFCLAEDWKGE